MRITILAAACMAALSAPALAANFGAPSITAGPHSVLALGDVNGDQLDDLVGDDAIQLQRADGTLAAPVHYPFPTNFSLARVLVDLNRDGTLDIANCADNGVQLLSAAAVTARFTEVDVPVTDEAGRTWTCQAIVALDVNHDGNPDLVALAAGDNQLVFLYGDGHGHVSSMTRQTLPQKAYRNMASGDVTGDGVADIILVGESLDVYPGKTTGGLGPVRTSARYDPSHSQEGVAVGDINSDGRNDVVVTEYANWPNTIVAVYAQASNGTLPYNPATTVTQDLPRKTLIADLDHTGRNMLLVAHEGTYGIGMYAGGPGGLNGEVPIAGQPLDTSLSDVELAIGDLNDDGCVDVVGKDYYYDNRYLFTGNGCDPRDVVADFDHDGKSDLVWRNTQTGVNVIWRAADSAKPQAVSTVASQAWQIAGSGDFNADRLADLVWHNAETGANTIWLTGNSATPRAMSQVTNLDWQIVGIGDFDGDGYDDVLWRNRVTGANTIWKSALSSAPMTVGALTDTHWKVVGFVDFDHDYHADILWRNDATGANMYWSGGNAAASHALTGVTDLSWTVAGVGDFDGDGRADVFWRNVATGTNVIWRAASPAMPMAVAAVTGNWSVVVGDYNGDGKADLLWRNAATGVDVMWRAGQATVQLPVTDVTSAAWKTVR